MNAYQWDGLDGLFPAAATGMTGATALEGSAVAYVPDHTYRPEPGHTEYASVYQTVSFVPPVHVDKQHYELAMDPIFGLTLVVPAAYVGLKGLKDRFRGEHGPEEPGSESD